MNNNKMIPNEQNKLKNLEKIDSLLNKDYLYRVERQYEVLDFSVYNKIENAEKNAPQYKISFESNIRALRVDRWVYDKTELSIDKFKNILNVFEGGDSNLAILIKREKDKTVLYFVLKNETTGKVYNPPNVDLLKNAITGNFQGTSVENDGSANNPFHSFSDKEKINSISCLTNIPSEKSERFVSQGLEKLLDGIRPQKDEDAYYVIILAEPLSYKKIQDIQNGYENLATITAPYSGYQIGIGENKTETEGTMESLTDSENISRAVAMTHSVSVNGGGEIGPVNVGGGYSFSTSDTKSKGTGTAETTGKNYNLSVGASKNITCNYQNFTVQGLLEKLQKQIERINNSKALGLWKCASYVLSGSPETTINVANFLKSLTQGEESYIEPPVINTWSKAEQGSIFFQSILAYLEHFTHPVFGKENLPGEKEKITPTYNVSTIELSRIMAFPRKSVSGLPVLECAEFGREVVSLLDYKGESIPIGQPYHMHMLEIQQLPIMLNKKSLASHTFITGSTGSGKSNTIFSILKELDKSIPFLVIEPAKGEYKHAFCDSDNISVYGTNPDKGMMLKINPFSFNKEIRILEHLDRLIEIFNACWPMFAAMSAILKQAVEIAYEQTGWNLQTSKNKYDDSLFPTFKDVCGAVLSVMNISEYSDENKGNYKGALVTRLNSLTNGLNGLIFVNEELSEEELFEKRTIVDLSRVGSMDTKALIMGMLVMKLQEYRMTGEEVDYLRHVTVLEEAHNLLKRTSTEQSSENANLLGKSVEMLANSIAEMRAFGEGFIIADQSPGLLDMSVIRNTNTKIIMRLPDQSDRELVGKAANLNDDQIVELARLERGVAAVFQSEWIQPVLCKVTYFPKPKERYKPKNFDIKMQQADSEETIVLKRKITKYLLSNMIHEPQELSKEKVAELRNEVLHSKIEPVTKARICDFILEKQALPNSLEPIYKIISGLYGCPKDVFDEIRPKTPLTRNWIDSFNKKINPSIQDIKNFNKETQCAIMQCIVLNISAENIRLKDLPAELVNFKQRSI